MWVIDRRIRHRDHSLASLGKPRDARNRSDQLSSFFFPEVGRTDWGGLTNKRHEVTKNECQ